MYFAAYEILSDPDKRKKYDKFGEAAFETGGQGAGGFGDFHFNFDDFFKGFDEAFSSFSGKFIQIVEKSRQENDQIPASPYT